MLCITGGETDAEALAGRLARYGGAPLQEARLDLLQRGALPGTGALSGHDNLLVTCRRAEEGGGFPGSEQDRVALLERALEHRPRWMDIELGTPAPLRRALRERCRQRGTRVLLSVHALEPAAGGIQGMAERLAAEPADALKIALPVEDAADLSRLLELLPRERRPLVKVGMGPAGMLSRALYRRFGSPWTYVAAEGSLPSAPGQLSLQLARQWGIGAPGPERTPLGLLGGPSIAGSPGPGVYNELFSQRGLPYIYLPVTTSRPREALDLLEELGFGGVSVTIPAKETLAASVDSWCPGHGAEAGALNTVLLQRGRRLGANTDVEAIITLLAGDGVRRALVLGAGGAARAAVFALRRVGASVSVSGRDSGRAAALARQLGAAPVPWDRRGEVPFEVLVNATPCGGPGVCPADPLPEGVPLQDRLVLDAVISPGPTPLVLRARAGGGRAISGLEWWACQGAAQISLMTGQLFHARDLTSLLDRPRLSGQAVSSAAPAAGKPVPCGPQGAAGPWEGCPDEA